VERRPGGLRSTRIAFPILGTDRRGYTRRNWVGINPFVSLSGIEATFSRGPHGRTDIALRLDRTRSLGWGAYFLSIAGLIAVVAPWPARLILVTIISLFLLGNWFMVPRLVRAEVQACLAVPSAPRTS